MTVYEIVRVHKALWERVAEARKVAELCSEDSALKKEAEEKLRAAEETAVLFDNVCF